MYKNQYSNRETRHILVSLKGGSSLSASKQKLLLGEFLINDEKVLDREKTKPDKRLIC